VSTRHSRRSFTLLELMIAFVIMAILAAVAIPSLTAVAQGDRAQADQATAQGLADAAYYKAFSADTTGSGAQPVDYSAAGNGLITAGSGSPARYPVSTDLAGTLLYASGDAGTIYYNFADGVVVSVTADTGTDSSPSPTTAIVVGVGATPVGTTTSSTTTTLPPADSIELAASLNTGERSQINAISCTSPGDCVAGGFYEPASGQAQAFIDVETSNSWAAPTEIAASLNVGAAATVSSVSCPSLGNCAVGGQYATGPSTFHAFVDDEVSGNWDTPQPVAVSLDALSAGNVASVSCSSPGNCAAVGAYVTSDFYHHDFVVDEVGGSWLSPQNIDVSPGYSTSTQLTSVSCPSDNNCSATGTLTDTSGNQEAFVADQLGGTWGSAQLVADVLNVGNVATGNSISCSSPGNCAAAGQYTALFANTGAFVADEVSGHWSTAQDLSASLGPDLAASATSVSCSADQRCTVVGQYSAGANQAFVADEVSGLWTSQEVLTTPGPTGNNLLNAVSCSSPGNCTATGTINNTSEPAAVSEVSGNWGSGQELGASLNPSPAYGAGTAISCSSDNNCTVGGFYQDPSSALQSFASTQTSGIWTP
jgi:prepilin-type N-terminal cleavage/methylation domain-containing protein